MKYFIELSGKELVLLYVAFGNIDAYNIIQEAIASEKDFEENKKKKEKTNAPK